MKGLRASIYTDEIGECSNGGISSRVKYVTIVGDGIPEIFTADDKAPAVKIVRRVIWGKPYVHAEPVDQPEGTAGPMAGGCFIYSSDSRFPHQYPISLHDRFECWDMYDRMSR